MDKRKLRVKALLIDLDGTLVDSTEAYRDAGRAGSTAIGLKRYDARATFEVARRLEQGVSIDDVLAEIKVDEALRERFLSAYLDAYYSAVLVKTKPLYNVFKTLQTLSQSLSLALITLRFVSRERVADELERLGFNRYFKAVVTALDVKKPKPFPDALKMAAKRLSVPINVCAMVGDSVVDVQAGKLAGAKTVAVLSGLFTRTELEREKPDLIIKNINSLPKFLAL